MLGSSASKNSPTQDEDANLGSSIQSSGQDMIVFHIPIGIILADVVLGE
jgi:hypothetical protein